MAANIKRLLNKKRLTGEDVGKALISHSAVVMKNAKTAENNSAVKGLFTDDELNKMVQSLNTSHDIAVYTGYREVLYTIRHLLTKLELAIAEYGAAEWQALYIYSNCLQAETANTVKLYSPLIVTKAQLEEELRKERETRGNRRVTHAAIAKDVILHFLSLYKSSPDADNPFKEIFDQLSRTEADEAKKNEYENNFCVSYCYQTPAGQRSDSMTAEEWRTVTGSYEIFTADFIPSSKHPIEPARAAAGLNAIRNNQYADGDILSLTPFNILRTVSTLDNLSELEYLSVLNNYSVKTKEDISRFLKEYRLLIYTAAKYMNASNALRHEAKATIAAMSNEELIKDLSENNFLDFPDRHNAKPDDLFAHLSAGYAVLQGEEAAPPEPSSPYDYFSISKDGAAINAIKSCSDKLQHYYFRANAIYHFLSLIAEESGTPELKDLIEEFKVDSKPLESLNEMSGRIKQNITRYSGFLRRDAKKTADALKLFESVSAPFSPDNIEPAEESKAEARELIRSHFELYGSQERIIKILDVGTQKRGERAFLKKS